MFEGINAEAYQVKDDYKSKIESLCQALAIDEYCHLESDIVELLLKERDPLALSDWQQFSTSWHDLSSDLYMADGGKYRTRRHATLSALPSSVFWTRENHEPHYQSVNYNTLNGGIARHYEPINDEVIFGNTFKNIMIFGCEIFSRLNPYNYWHIEVHQFRIKAGENHEGKPTPEGIHRDGVNYVIMVLIDRVNVLDGTTNIYDLDKRLLSEFTLKRPMSLAIVNDEKVFHGVTPHPY